MGLITANFLVNLLCAVANCGPRYAYPSDPTSVQRISNVELTQGKYTEYPVVRAKQGRIRGYTMKTITGKPIYAFEGIPYAESPEGKNRFQPPARKRRWGGIRNAFSVGNPCLQFNTLRVPAVIYGREDCLYLNIYTPQEAVTGDRKLPVLFWIHGGSFYFGSGAEEGPAYLLDKDVILVTINYRLGILGFLSTGDDIVPGNNGLKDQAQAFQWVHENIEEFGGDPKKITMIGQSAGAASVHFHMLNENTRKHIFAGIAMSGSALQPWAFRTEKIRRLLNRKLAKALNCPFESREFLQCLKNVNPFLLTGVQQRMFAIPIIRIILFGPVAEKISSNSSQTPYITRTPTEIYASGNAPHIPLMFTKTSGEAHIPSVVIRGFGRFARLGFNYFWKNQADDFLEVANVSDDPVEVIEKLEAYYFRGKKFNEVDSSLFDSVITDRFHGVGIQKAILSHYNVAPTFALLMSGPIRFAFTTEVLGVPVPPQSIIHGDDVHLIFNSSTGVQGLKTTDPEYRLSQIMTGLIFNFAKSGVPNYDELTLPRLENLEEWQPVTNPCHIVYLNVSTTETRLTTLSRKTLENYEFWESLNLDDVPKTPKFCVEPT